MNLSKDSLLVKFAFLFARQEDEDTVLSQENLNFCHILKYIAISISACFIIAMAILAYIAFIGLLGIGMGHVSNYFFDTNIVFQETEYLRPIGLGTATIVAFGCIAFAAFYIGHKACQSIKIVD